MIRPISVASNGLVSNERKSLSIASEGMLLSTAITIPELATPKYIFSTGHNLDKLKRVQKIIRQDEIDILEIISFVAKRIL